jgi:hypothetical protein
MVAAPTQDRRRANGGGREARWRELGNRQVISTFPPHKNNTSVTFHGYIPRWFVRRVSTVSVPDRTVGFALILHDPDTSPMEKNDEVLEKQYHRSLHQIYGVGMFRMR